ncbi:MAG: hypothetical protein FWG83_02355 [Oscillospiraceae bacterium]|nr:hypothetical protein [Oscillospiraceae bacterium]
MIKGVNKLIVEVSNPESEFFERAIFFVKPQKKDTPPKELNKSADALLLKQARFGTGKNHHKKGVPFGITFAGAAGFGAAVTAVLLKVL